MQPDMSGCVLNRPTFGSVKPSHSPAQPSISSQAQFQAPRQPRKFWFWIWNPHSPMVYFYTHWMRWWTYVYMIYAYNLSIYFFCIYIIILYATLIQENSIRTSVSGVDCGAQTQLFSQTPLAGLIYLSVSLPNGLVKNTSTFSNPRSTAHLNMFSSKSSTTISHAFLYVYIYINII